MHMDCFHTQQRGKQGNQESQARGERGEVEETQRDIDSVIIINI